MAISQRIYDQVKADFAAFSAEYNKRHNVQNDTAPGASVRYVDPEVIEKAEYQMNQAQEDIENIAWRLGEQQRYATFLQEQRDKCQDGSAEYFKWQSKLSVVDDKIYRLDKQRRAAYFKLEQAQRKLAR